MEIGEVDIAIVLTALAAGVAMVTMRCAEWIVQPGVARLLLGLA